ncbi:MAG: cell wall hydrolase [Bacillales bacterium]|nr:cell wall hydrolase [Bacillales bacterium]
MSRCRYSSSELSLLARLMRAEAVGEGVFGMQLVGNVVINRVVARCVEFRNKKTIKDVIYTKNAFAGIKSNLFKSGATAKERTYALRTINFWRAEPANYALYFYAPGKNKKCKSKFYGVYTGRYKGHCFYKLSSNKGCGL